MEWSSEVTLEFLRLYEQESAIWNPKDPLHKNRTAVAEAWRRIEGSLSIKCSVKELKKKKESLMATFRPLLNKVKASMKTGSGADEVYKPNWFAFETMAKFLNGIYQPRSTINIQEVEDGMSVDSMEQNEDEDEEEEECSRTEDCTENGDDTEIPSRIIHRSPDNTFKALADRGATRKRKVMKLETIHGRMEEAYRILKNVSEKPDKDECSLYAELLAKKLRVLDENTREIVMHEINNLMFHTKMRKQNPQSFQTPLSTHPGGLYSTTPSVETYNNHPFSFPQHSHLSMPTPSSQPSPGNSACSPYSKPYSGNSSPAHCYYSQPSPGNTSTSHLTTTGNQESAVSQSENPSAVAILGSTMFD